MQSVEPKTLMWIGADPGKGGCVATLTETDMIHIHDYDETNMIEWLQYQHERYQVDEVAIEKVHGTQQMGIKNACAFTGTFHWLRGVFQAIFDHAPVQVTPQAWKKMFGLLGKDKEASRLKAIELFPHYEQFLSRKKDHDRAEAILIAEYARRISR